MTSFSASLGLDLDKRSESLAATLHHEARHGDKIKANLHVAQADRTPTQSQLIRVISGTLTSAFDPQD